MPTPGAGEKTRTHTETPRVREEGKQSAMADVVPPQPPSTSINASPTAEHSVETGPGSHIEAGRHATTPTATLAPVDGERCASRNGAAAAGAAPQKAAAQGDTGSAPAKKPVALVNKGRNGGGDVAPPGTQHSFSTFGAVSARFLFLFYAPCSSPITLTPAFLLVLWAMRSCNAL